MEEEFENKNPEISFDFKGFLLRLMSYWYLFVICIVIGLGIAYYINVRKQPVYQLSSLVSIKDDQNPFFTSNTSLTFNWGGISDKVSTSVIALKTRSHNEKVVEELDLYIQYLIDGDYQKVDVYGQVPFKLDIDSLKGQLYNYPIKINFLTNDKFKISVDFDNPGIKNLMVYEDKSIIRKKLKKSYGRVFTFGENINLPFLKGQLSYTGLPINKNKDYYVKFLNFNSVVKDLKNINVTSEQKGAPVLNLSYVDGNKTKIVDVLNTTTKVLSRDMLNRKNLFATKTIRFIDSSLAVKAEELEGVEEELNSFMAENEILDLDTKVGELKIKLSTLDLNEEEIEKQLDYYEILEDYLRSREDYRNVPAPSVTGIKESSVTSLVSKIVALSQERSTIEYSTKENFPTFNDIDRQINATKTVLLENIESSRGLMRKDLKEIKQDISELERESRMLPKEQQDLLNIERRYNLSEQTYNLFLGKRTEAGLVKAANVSDLMVIDKAKDVGGGANRPQYTA